MTTAKVKLAKATPAEAPAEAISTETAAVSSHADTVKTIEDAVSFGQANLDALMTSGTILTRGLQDLAQALLSLTQQSLEESIAASQALLSAKTLDEVIDVQSSLTKSNIDKLLAEGTRLSDQSVKLVEDTVAPIGAIINATVDKLLKSAA